MISLALLFLLVPVYFSHLLAPFDIFLNLDAFFSGAWTEILTMSGSSFERYKTYLFFVFLVSACFEIGFTHTKFFVNSCKKYWKWLMIFLLVPMISYLLYDLDTTLFFIGSEEKHHGYIWYAGFVVLTFLLTMLTFQEKKKLIIVSMGGASIVAWFALLEGMVGGSVFFDTIREAPWGDFRSVSTLGNPNYVAGYLLFHLPLSSLVTSYKKYIFLALIFLGIITTGSYIGIFLSLVFLFASFLSKFLTLRATMITLGNIIFFVFLVAFLFLSSEKLLSFESRGILMQEVIGVFVTSPISIFIGYSPDSILQYFEGPRSALINSYFPPTSAIDSSHSIFLDFLFQYGIILFGLALAHIIQIWKHLGKVHQLSLVYGWIFLALNVTITVHVMVILLLLSMYTTQKSPNTLHQE